MDFSGKHILMGVCGGIAAYKACEVIRTLQKLGAEKVSVVMTSDAEAFIGKLTFEALTKQPVITDHLAVDNDGVPWHIALAQQADVFCIVPATANCMAKLANGLADDMVTTTALCWTDKPLLVAPAMNTRMWNHPSAIRNREVLASFPDVTMIAPTEGLLACGETGAGHLASERGVCQGIYKACHAQSQLYSGYRFVVTAGGTHERMDPVRHLSNRSSGRMGLAFADELWVMGAEVDLMAGITVEADLLQDKSYPITRFTTADDLHTGLISLVKEADGLVMTAAVSDFHVANQSDEKVKREAGNDGSVTLALAPNPDILASIAKKFPNLYTLGFAAETNNSHQLAQDKMTRKGIDALCLNDISRPDIGFDASQNEVVLFQTVQSEKTATFDKAPKWQIAQQVLTEIYPAVVQKTKTPKLNATSVNG